RDGVCEFQLGRWLQRDQVAPREQFRVAEIRALLVYRIARPESTAGWILIPAEKNGAKAKPRTQGNRVNAIASLRRDSPGANVIGTKGAPLKGKLVVVIPVIRGSPDTCADGFPLFPARPFAVERNGLVIEAHVVEIHVSLRQKSKRVDRIDGPKTASVIRRIIEVAGSVQSRPHGKQIDGPIPLHPGKTSPIEAAPDIAAVPR